MKPQVKKTVRINAMIESDIFHQLEILSKKMNTTYSEIIRCALNNYLKKELKKFEK